MNDTTSRLIDTLRLQEKALKKKIWAELLSLLISIGLNIWVSVAVARQSGHSAYGFFSYFILSELHSLYLNTKKPV